MRYGKGGKAAGHGRKVTGAGSKGKIKGGDRVTKGDATNTPNILKLSKTKAK